MERKPLHPYRQGGVPKGASLSDSDNISEKIAAKFIRGKTDSSEVKSSVRADSAEAAQKKTLESRKKTENKDAKSEQKVKASVPENKNSFDNKSKESKGRASNTPRIYSKNVSQKDENIHPIKKKNVETIFSRPMESPVKGSVLPTGVLPSEKLHISKAKELQPLKEIKAEPSVSAEDDKYKLNIYTYDKIQQQIQEKKEERQNAQLMPKDKGCVKNHTHLANPIAALGHIATGVIVHSTTAYATHQKVSRYTGTAKEVAMGTLDALGGVANRTAFRKDLKGGRIKTRLEAAGIDTRILQKQSVFQNKNGQNKKKLSNKDLKLIEKALVTAFRQGSLHSVDLSKMSDRELNKTIRSLSKGQGKEIAKAYRDVRRARRVTYSKAGRIKAFAKGGRARKSLTSLATMALYQTEAGQGVRLIQRYVRTLKASISFGVKVHRLNKTIARRLIKPYDIHIKKKEIKKADKRDKKNLKKQEKYTKRINKKTERIKTLRKRMIQPAKRRIQTTQLGKKVRAARIRVHYSKPAKTFRNAKKKLAPVAKVGNKATGLLAKGFGKLVNIAKAVVDLDETVKNLLFMAVGAGLILIMIPVLGMAAIVSVLDLLPTSPASEKYNNKPAIEVVADKIKEKDEAWFQSLQDATAHISAETANGGKKVYGGDDPLTGNRIELVVDDKTKTVYKFYNGFMFDIIDTHSSSFDKNKLNDENSIAPYSSLQAIACAGNIYRNNTGCNEDEYIEYCMQLYDHTHKFQTGVGNPHFCPAGDCKKVTIQCTDENTIEQIKKSHTAKYYEDKEKNENCTYAYLVNNLEKNNHDGKGCTTYYCTEKNTVAHAKKCEPIEYKGEENNGFTAFCDFTQSCENKKNITYKGIPGVNERDFEKDHDGDGKPDGYYEDTADTSSNSVPGTNYEDCSYAKDIVTSGISAEQAKNALEEGKITLTTKTRMYQEKEYYLGYCDDLYSLTTDQSKVDGYFLLVRKRNAKGKYEYSIATEEGSGKPMYFVACQGHFVKKRVFYYCQGKHYGCNGHEIAYCPGHITLEIYACIAGYDSQEAKINKAENNILYADNTYYKDSSKIKDPNIAWYNKKWTGFKNSDCSWIESMLGVDWMQNYHIAPENYIADSMTKLSSS